MLYHLIRRRRGKDEIVTTGELPRVTARMRQLRASQMRGIGGDRVTYRTEPAPDATAKAPFRPHRRNQDGTPGPPRVRPKSR